ncbi:hypothetical protein ACTACB_25000 [Pseudomonas syringae]|uniref:hypothetical protein n=1 Tax=Pseudomonas syringae TaxID=317 RepID=UPI003F7580A9
MLIELDLNMDDSESLLRHCTNFQPASGDCRGDARLADALEALAFAIEDSMNTRHSTHPPVEMIALQLLEAATGLFGDRAIALNWLSHPIRALGGKAPRDVEIEKAIELITRLEYGFSA